MTKDNDAKVPQSDDHTHLVDESSSIVAKAFYKSPFFWAFIVGALFLTMLRPMQESLLFEAPPPLVLIDDWSLIDHEGASIGSASLKGKVVIADYFFTRCPSVCPKLTAAMENVRARTDDLGDHVRYLSFTVDPENDTPAVLAAHRKEKGIDDDRWRMVTGTADDVRHTLVDVMKVPVGDRVPVDGNVDLFDIAHQMRLALFDQDGHLRALFPIDDDGRRAIVAAARMFVKRGPTP